MQSGGEVGKITGTITTKNPSSEGQTLKVTQDNDKACGNTVPDETLLAKGGKLANAVVYVKGAPVNGIQPGKVTIDQQACRFHPHVSAVLKGTKMEIINSDPVLHNVHDYDGSRTVFNLAMPLKDQKIVKKATMGKEEITAGLSVNRLGCDAGHTWMSAYVAVAETPYIAVTDANGAFTIPDVPVGTYGLLVWHEKLGTTEGKVTVTAGGTATVNLDLSK